MPKNHLAKNLPINLNFTYLKKVKKSYRKYFFFLYFIVKNLLF